VERKLLPIINDTRNPYFLDLLELKYFPNPPNNIDDMYSVVKNIMGDFYFHSPMEM